MPPPLEFEFEPKLENSKKEGNEIGYEEDLARELLYLGGCAYLIEDKKHILREKERKMDNKLLEGAMDNLTKCVEGGKEMKLAGHENWDWRTGRGQIMSQQCDDGGFYCVWFLAWSEWRRRIVVVFRGTDSYGQLFEEVSVTVRQEMAKFQRQEELGMVNAYFAEALNNSKWLMRDGSSSWFRYPASIWQITANKLKEIAAGDEFNKEPFTIAFTGHSLGGALAALSAANFAYFMSRKEAKDSAIQTQINFLREQKRRIECEVYTFGEPRVGNKQFAETFELLVPKSFRIVNGHDLVAHVPPCEIDKERRNCSKMPENKFAYFHHGTEIWYPDGMEKGHKYEKCESESEECSNQLFVNRCLQRDFFMDWLKLKNFQEGRKSIQNHLHYFGHAVSAILDSPLRRILLHPKSLDSEMDSPKMEEIAESVDKYLELMDGNGKGKIWKKWKWGKVKSEGIYEREILMEPLLKSEKKLPGRVVPVKGRK